MKKKERRNKFGEVTLTLGMEWTIEIQMEILVYLTFIFDRNFYLC